MKYLPTLNTIYVTRCYANGNLSEALRIAATVIETNGIEPDTVSVEYDDQGWTVLIYLNDYYMSKMLVKWKSKD